MGRKQYGGRAGGATDSTGAAIYAMACGPRVRQKKSGRVSWKGQYTPSDYEPVPFNKINRILAEDDKVFIAACELAGVQPTARQYSKWRNGRGAARAQV